MARELELRPKETALVLIDLEHGIVARDTKPYPSKDVVSRCAQLATALREAGGLVVYVHVLMHEMKPPAADKPMMKPGTPPSPPEASELVPEAGYRPGTDVLVTKRQWGAFYGTDLEQQLRERGITTVIMGGIATNVGVESTARAALDARFELVFAEDAMATFSEEAHRNSLEGIFPVMGRVRSTAEIVGSLRGNVTDSSK